ncbi:MAG: SMC-Scp complex subunit ScpB [Clostridia bacterium]|nr:SMC-Scp complex subunit ScpB [Clostridia bacterium]MBO5755591.1 SMC-Scp complex subunit ScpB [Clostridia bacterium]
MTTPEEKLNEKEGAQNTLASIEDAAEHFEEILEAVLFAAGHPVPYDRLAALFDMSVSILKERVIAFASLYNSDPQKGIIFLTYDDTCQLCTKEKYLPYIRAALGIKRNGTLSNSSIEVLAVIAYHQPVTRAYIDAVRGVDSAYAVSTLLDRGLIESVGRLDAPGRPMLYGTTDDFLRCFGLSSLSELPGVSSEEAADLLARMRRNAMDPSMNENQLSMDEALLDGEAAPAAPAKETAE